MKYLSKSDQVFTKRLIAAILKRGFMIAIHNGECYEEFEKHVDGRPKLSTHKASIHKAVGATGQDSIKVIELDENNNAQRKGHFFLIYNNGFDMEEGVGVIADYSANELCDEIYNSLGG